MKWRPQTAGLDREGYRIDWNIDQYDNLQWIEMSCLDGTSSYSIEIWISDCLYMSHHHSGTWINRMYISTYLCEGSNNYLKISNNHDIDDVTTINIGSEFRDAYLIKELENDEYFNGQSLGFGSFNDSSKFNTEDAAQAYIKENYSTFTAFAPLQIISSICR